MRGAKERERGRESNQRGERREVQEKRERRRERENQNGTGECSLEPITVARPGVRQTLYSFSNNANKRASILRFYRTALSIFDNGHRRSGVAMPKATSPRVAFTASQLTSNGINETRLCPRDSPPRCTHATFLRLAGSFFDERRDR